METPHEYLLNNRWNRWTCGAPNSHCVDVAVWWGQLCESDARLSGRVESRLPVIRRGPVPGCFAGAAGNLHHAFQRSRTHRPYRAHLLPLRRVLLLRRGGLANVFVLF